MEIYRVRINRVDDLGDLVRVYYFDKPAGFDWDEGAHVHLGLPGFDAGEKRDKTLVRHMSILTLVEEDTVGVITRLDSSDSRYKLMITDMKPGDEASLFKIGSALRLKRDGRPVVILTMGVAVGAMRPLAISYANNPEGIPEMTAITVNRRDTYPFKEELEALEAPRLTLHHVKSRAAFQHALLGLILDNKPWFLIIGSNDFLRDCIYGLRDRGISPDDMVVDLKPEKRAVLFESLKLGNQDQKN